MQERAAAEAGRRKAGKALKTLRANMLAALAKAVAEDGLGEDDAEDFLQQKYGQRLEQVAEHQKLEADELAGALWHEATAAAAASGGRGGGGSGGNASSGSSSPEPSTPPPAPGSGASMALVCSSQHDCV